MGTRTRAKTNGGCKMREIKFMLFFEGWEEEPEFYTINEMIDNYDIKKYKAIFQYTGRKDKYGKEIYDRSIVKSSSGKIAEVRINDCILEWNIYPPYHFKKDGVNVFGIMAIGHSDLCEVIGHMFNNKELLK